MTCSKCRGLVVMGVGADEARCILCGKYYFPPEPDGEICSQGGTCGRTAEKDGLCAMHWRQRLDNINKGRSASRRYRR